jgi:excisionase family DNA binding protein
MGRMLTVDEVAGLLNVSTRTVRRLANEGVLTRVRVGHRIARYTPRSVLALMDPENDTAPADTGAGSELEGGSYRAADVT